MKDSVDDMEDYSLVFGRTDKWSPYQIAKTILCSIILLPFRLTVLVFTCFVFSIIARAAVIGIPADKLYNTPLSNKRRKLINVAQICAKNLGDFSNIALVSLGFWKTRVAGKYLPRYPQVNVYVANHSSWIDILAIIATLDVVPSFVAKRTIESIPLLGYDAKATQCIFIDRLKKRAGAGDLIKERASNFEMPPVVVFPEGTTSNGRQLIKFHTGAFLNGTPVRPVLIKYPHKHFSPTWESISALKHIFCLLTQFSNYLEVIFLPIYVPNEEEKVNPELYAKKVQKVMADALRIPIKDSYSYEAKVEYLRSKKC